jgi:ABC-type uncharacterized transport system substrate-binding protein
MKSKSLFWLLTTVWLITAFAAEAQQPGKVPRIGFLSATQPGRITRDSFRQGLHDLGYIEGKNIIIEWRYAEGNYERLPDLVAELISLKVDVIVAGATEAVRVAKNMTSTIPIVMAAPGDPVSTGLAASHARPGGNVTGISSLGGELGGKRLELLKETFPRVSRIAVLWDPVNPAQGIQVKVMEDTARILDLKLQLLEIRDPSDFDRAFSAISKQRANAFSLLRSPLIRRHQAQILDFTEKKRLPAMYPESAFVDAGGLMSYGPHLPDLWRRAAIYVDKILKGTKPADLPVEGPKKFELVINLKTAKQIGLTIPPNVLARADRVIR